MKGLLISACLLLVASVNCSTIRQQNVKRYVVTAPKIFLGEESVCLTLFDRQQVPANAVLRVQLQSQDGEDIFETEQQLTSGEQSFDRF